ncbi:MAG: tRNA preQ1(34) S-adenosylmethionine ribosyltransferase-isomerase QueA [Kosmotoga sp.]|nr:MAG: tRNA preQ1(34) S-adenosylmethionine ribosyltransferase-isomerase QueA [Kosmotoga sp.]
MKTSEFDFNLPDRLIAHKSAEKREKSRLLIYHNKSDKIEHKKFEEILNYFDEGDVLVLNNSRVIPARLFARKPTGAEIELLLLNEKENNKWEALARPRKRLKTNKKIIIEDIEVEVAEKTEWGGVIVKFPSGLNVYRFLEKNGYVPIPPYIKNEDQKYLKKRYQTVFAEKKGSIAAPTSGLHFSKDLLEKIKLKGVKIAYLTLHVGLGTFEPVKVKKVENFDIHSEYYELEKETVEKINNARGKIVCCGTTVTRTLEYVHTKFGKLKPSKGWCDLFIYPGYDFKVIDNLITNFHLPKSSLIMLVAALTGKEKILSIYKKAICREYRFYSFGDAMFIMDD